MKDGQPQKLNQRLFMQLLAFGGGTDAHGLAVAMADANLAGVVYEDVNDPRGVALLTFSEDPAYFLDRVRPVLNSGPFASLVQKPEYTMLGRTYSLGYEPDLADVLLQRPRRTVLNPAWMWAVWYPLRRIGAYNQLEPIEQSHIMREHAAIGMAYGQKELAHDIRLACHGLDANDNEFVIGLIGKELHPLSHIVQSMRQTRQTSEFISQMGPFFVGRAVWQSAI